MDEMDIDIGENGETKNEQVTNNVPGTKLGTNARKKQKKRLKLAKRLRTLEDAIKDHQERIRKAGAQSEETERKATETRAAVVADMQRKGWLSIANLRIARLPDELLRKWIDDYYDSIKHVYEMDNIIEDLEKLMG